MPSAVEFRRATPVQRRAIFCAIHRQWGAGLTLAEHLRHRSEAAPFRAAEWWVAQRDGDVVSSLARYSLRFVVEDESCKGVGLGSVFTPEQERGQGLATDLCKHVLEDARGRGEGLALLFSEIGASLYARLGFEVLDSSLFECRDPSRIKCEALVELESVDPRVELSYLVEQHTAWRRRAGFGLERDAAAWQLSIDAGGGHCFERIELLARARGYVRWKQTDAALHIVELAVDDEGVQERDRATSISHLDRDDIASACYAILAKRAATEGKALVTWLVPPPAISAEFRVRQRSDTLAMLAALDEGSDAARIAARSRGTLVESDAF